MFLIHDIGKSIYLTCPCHDLCPSLIHHDHHQNDLCHLHHVLLLDHDYQTYVFCPDHPASGHPLIGILTNSSLSLNFSRNHSMMMNYFSMNR